MDGGVLVFSSEPPPPPPPAAVNPTLFSRPATVFAAVAACIFTVVGVVGNVQGISFLFISAKRPIEIIIFFRPSVNIYIYVLFVALAFAPSYNLCLFFQGTW